MFRRFLEGCYSLSTGFPSFTSVRTLARVMETRATSELEKNAESRTQMIKRRISMASRIIRFHNVRVHAYLSRFKRGISLLYSEANLIKPALSPCSRA